MASLYEETCDALNRARVEYLVIGGFAVNFYGYNRSTSDLDFFINPQDENINRLFEALQSMGFETNTELNTAIQSGQVVHFREGLELIEMLFKLNLNVSFDVLYARATKSGLGISDAYYISLDDLIAEKVKANRPKDLNDVMELQKINKR